MRAGPAWADCRRQGAAVAETAGPRTAADPRTAGAESVGPPTAEEVRVRPCARSFLTPGDPAASDAEPVEHPPGMVRPGTSGSCCVRTYRPLQWGGRFSR